MIRGLVAAAVALGACDARRTPAADTTREPPSDRQPASDTIVRRVVRYVGAASAIQRVTGPIAARRAGEQLDSVLAVRVLDVQGDELPGARVEWQMRTGAPGARLLVLNDVTDSLGVSRARFVTGRAADPQVVSAEVAGVGRIDFAVTVPVAAIALDAPPELWSGDEAVVSAILRDSAAAVLAGGHVQWATTDSAALRLSASDSQRVVVTGALAGRAEVWGWSGNLRGTAPIVVRPVLDLVVFTLNGAPVDATARIAAPAPVELSAPAGTFRARVTAPAHAEVVIEIAPADSQRYHPARLRVTDQRQLQALRVVLIPRQWRIDGGAYAGEELPIDADAALSPVAGRAPFWRMSPVSGRGLKTILGWHPSRLPIPIAFDRGGSAAAITPADSASFWSAARQLERDLGASLFRPATLDDPDAVRVEIRSSGSEGHTFTSSTQDGNVNDGTLLFRAPATLRDPHVVTHELVHLLGFGHSRSWPTVSVPAGGIAARLTPHDVAYMQLAMRLRRSGMTIGFPRLAH